MKRLFSVFVISFLALLLVLPNFASAESTPPESNIEANDGMHDDHGSYDDDDDCIKKVKYSEKQKRKLDKIYDQIYLDYKRLFETYVEYGTMSQEDLIEKLKKLKKFQEKVKSYEYQWCMDDDDWEEFDD